ncbi:hemerythrin domain-containing protein [Mumia quercus]|uniref:hemerythrin domain-containing protein n=1 Tax=Mumia quercus TaxID=2976125 RepID=UPI0021D3C27A|nr:hemerythrin domain-containing protein [Mumia quercus]
MRPSPDPAHARAAAFGVQLVAVHDELRDHLAQLLAAFDAPDDEVVPTPALRTHCLAFCSVLTRHHTSEDDVAFPAIAAQVPELAPVLAELAHDHGLIAHLVRGIEHRVSAAAPEDGTGTRARLRAEVDGLASVLESHLRWEERRIVAALDGLAAPGVSAVEMFGWEPRDL